MLPLPVVRDTGSLFCHVLGATRSVYRVSDVCCRHFIVVGYFVLPSVVAVARDAVRRARAEEFEWVATVSSRMLVLTVLRCWSRVETM
jgi:hypothetical protein